TKRDGLMQEFLRMPVQASAHAAEIDQMTVLVHWLMAVLFVGWGIYYVLVFYAIPAWAKRVKAFPSENEAVVVRVVAEQFAWNMHYPGPDGRFGRTDLALISAENPLGLDRRDAAAKDDITTINQLNLPVDRPVLIHLS